MGRQRMEEGRVGEDEENNMDGKLRLKKSFFGYDR